MDVADLLWVYHTHQADNKHFTFLCYIQLIVHNMEVVLHINQEVSHSFVFGFIWGENLSDLIKSPVAQTGNREPKTIQNRKLYIFKLYDAKKIKINKK